jgi:uncharacterized protein (TIGR02646 family)
MIQLPDLALDPGAAAQLAAWQSEINTLPSYSDRVAQGKAKFTDRNTARNATFGHVRRKLAEMCQGARRCAYCEDSVADEVEHIKPKDLYPEEVFAWGNYVYACGPCNGPKNNRFEVLSHPPLQRIDVTRRRGAPVVPPLAGVPALINPRAEDPLHFLSLDLMNTFIFLPAYGLDPAEKLRAEYTLEVLHLNDRDYLIQNRRTAFGTYRDRLTQYIAARDQGEPQATLDQRVSELQRVGHQTVWREMKRQRSNYSLLTQLFSRAPEALAW